MVDEVNALKNRGVWRVVKVPNGGGVRLIKSKYVYRVKKNWAGQVIKRKSRLVVQEIDYDETFAPVAKVTTFRLMLALAKVLNLQINQLDVDSAFFVCGSGRGRVREAAAGNEYSIRLLSEVAQEPLRT